METVPGELALKFNSTANIQTRLHDRLVFTGVDFQKGPAIDMWSTVNEYCKAVGVINRRPWKECPLCRVVTIDAEAQANITIWEGYKAQLFEILATNAKAFTVKQSDWYMNVWCYELRAEGWKKMPNPLTADYNLRDASFIITDEQRKILEDVRFKVNTERHTCVL